ncbi:zinc finger protein 888-like isoform X2 [Maniola jurtina]|uniref:zinc finger protein 888-like isoform X2 n=1 Tax=Maniola jurtina TaxID=191418 RepID=UPI001E68E6F5|nr:zinc finger protein 888-like isoform X2 [Maniola jurtina]
MSLDVDTITGLWIKTIVITYSMIKTLELNFENLEMRCCVPFCKTTAEVVSESEISFHEFPSEAQLRAAWLRALGKQDTLLPEPAVVCSQHFLNDDIYETESGSRRIRTGAVPSPVLVCMICLDTRSKLLLMSKYNLDEAYQHLVGQPPCDQGNLKQTLCIQCAQRLVNFSRFRDKSLRARALMMELVEKHELITIQHMKSINRVKHQLKSDIVKTVLEPNHCDVHIVQSDTDTRTELDSTVEAVAVKHEERCDSVLVDADHTQHMTVASEEFSDADSFNGHPDACKEEYQSDDSDLSETEQMTDPLLTTPSTCKEEAVEAVAPIKQEITFACTICLMEFADEDMYNHHMMMHIEIGYGDGECDTSEVDKPRTAVSSSSAHSSVITENKKADLSPSAHAAMTLVAPVSAILAANNDNKVHTTNDADAEQKIKQEVETNNGGLQNQSVDSKILKKCVVKLYDIFKSFRKAPSQYGSLTETEKAVRSFDSQNIADKDFSYQATVQNEVPTTEYIESVTNSSTSTILSNVIKIQRIYLSQNRQTKGILFSCDVCRKNFIGKSFFIKHKQTHTEERRFTCKLCQYKSQSPSLLRKHMLTHEKPCSCTFCEYKSATNRELVRHMTTHTGCKPVACKLCKYICTTNSDLVCHTQTHSVVKPLVSCNLCDYKCTRKDKLVKHMRTHTGEKPYCCELCSYKCARKDKLGKHMRTHTGEKPYCCELCSYKCTRKDKLGKHMRTHTGEKPYCCELCSYKCAEKWSLGRHMRTHTGEKPYCCDLCSFKCAVKRGLVRHLKTHTGEKPYCCELCYKKFAEKSNLLKHIRTHTSKKPSSYL